LGLGLAFVVVVFFFSFFFSRAFLWLDIRPGEYRSGAFRSLLGLSLVMGIGAGLALFAAGFFGLGFVVGLGVADLGPCAPPPAALSLSLWPPPPPPLLALPLPPAGRPLPADDFDDGPCAPVGLVSLWRGRPELLRLAPMAASAAPAPVRAFMPASAEGVLLRSRRACPACSSIPGRGVCDGFDTPQISSCFYRQGAKGSTASRKDFLKENSNQES
jgi:hypothetical protein